MKKIISLLIIATMIISMSPNATVQASPDNQRAEIKIVRDDRSVYDNNGNLIFEKYYDKVILEETNTQMKAINSIIENDCERFFNSDLFYDLTNEEYGINIGNAYHTLDSEIVYNYNSILSIKVTDIWYYEGAGAPHPNTTIYGMNFDLNTGAFLDLCDIFSLSENEIIQYFKSNTSMYIKENAGYWYDINDTYNNLDDFKYYIKDDTVFLCYPPYTFSWYWPIDDIECPIIAKEEDGIVKSIDVSSFPGFPDNIEIELGDLPSVLYVRGQTGVTFKSDNNEVISLQPTNERGIFETALVSGVYVTGLAPGTATITATAPDGTSAQCFVTVKGKIADTIDDELVLKAKICANNALYQYMRDSYRDPSGIIVKGSNLYDSKLYKNINSFIDILGLDYSAEDYYEVALMDMIQNDNIYYEMYKDVIDNDFVKKLFDKGREKIRENMNANKVNFSGLKTFDIDKFYNNISFLDAIFTVKDVGEAMYEKYAQIYALSMVTSEQIKALEAVKAATLNDNIKKACDKVIKAQSDAAQETAEEIAYNTAFAGFDELGEFVGKRGWKALTNLIPGMTTAKIIVSAGKLVSNNLYNADDLSTDLLTMAAASEIHETARDTMKIKEAAFLRNQTADNALEFMAVADFYKALSIYGCDAALDFIKDVEYANTVQDAFKITAQIFPNTVLKSLSDLNDLLVKRCDSSTINEFKSSVNSIKSTVQDYNFYDPYGNDIANYIRDVVSTTPSEWAKPYVEKAINYGLIDTDYQNNYQNNITRAEFCTLLTYLINAKSDLTIDELAERAGRPDITVQFDDTMYVYVSEIARLGIINGTGNNMFEPLGEITRQQAAKILCETAKILGYDVSAPQTDLSGVDDWAKEGVNFVVDRGIMNGTDNGFEPQGTYTKEQAITTMVRFYENLR